jgi:hypothetical protein
MKIRLNTKRLGADLLVNGFHVSRHIEGPIEEVGTDEGKGYLLVTASRTLSTVAFGVTWDEASGFTKKLFLTSDSQRGLDAAPGIVRFQNGVSSNFITISSALIDNIEPNESRFEISVFPDTLVAGRRFHHQGLILKGQYEVITTIQEEQVLSHSMVLRSEYGNPKIASNEVMGSVEFDDVTFEIDGSNIFPSDPLNGEMGWYYIDSVELPVSTAVLARNFSKFKVAGITILQIPATTLDGRRLTSNMVDKSKPLSLSRANTVTIFRNL